MVQNTSRELSSYSRPYKSHVRSRNKQKSPYSKKVETTYPPQVWNIKDGNPMWSPEGDNYHVCSSQVLFVKEADFPVHSVMWTKRTRDVGEFLNTVTKEIPPFSLPTGRCPWYNGYRRWKWTRQHEFNSCTRLIAFHIALIPLGKVWIQLFSLQLLVKSRTNWFFCLDEATSIREGKLWIQTC